MRKKRRWAVEDAGGALYICCDGRRVADLTFGELLDDEADAYAEFIVLACKQRESHLTGRQRAADDPRGPLP